MCFRRSLFLIAVVAVVTLAASVVMMAVGDAAPPTAILHPSGTTVGSHDGPPSAHAAMISRDERRASAQSAVRAGGRVVAAADSQPRPVDDPAPTRTVWDRLADCESGDWAGDGTPVPGTAQWDYGAPGSGRFEGGLQFHPQTWESFKDPDMPGHAGLATRDQQIAVAEEVLRAQGWGAWPACASRLGLR